MWSRATFPTTHSNFLTTYMTVTHRLSNPPNQTPLKSRFTRAPFVKFVAAAPAASSTTTTTSENPTSGTAPDADEGESKPPREPRYAPKDHGWGLVGFDAPLKEEDVTFVKEKLGVIGGREVKWGMAGGECFKVSFFCREIGFGLGFTNRCSELLFRSSLRLFPTPHTARHPSHSL